MFEEKCIGQYIDCPPYVSHFLFVIFSRMDFLHPSYSPFADGHERCIHRSRPVVGYKHRSLPNLPVQSWMDQRQKIRVPELVGCLQSRGRTFRQRRTQETEDAGVWEC